VICNKALLDWFAPTADQALQIPVAASGFQLDTPRLIRAAHRRNVAVHYWTINDATEMKRLIELGADGIMTDRPDRLLEVLAAARR
jgi:glycerophosphoryl diester phosphodiesterase